MRKIRVAQIGINQYSHAAQIFKTLTMHKDVFDIVGYALVEDEREVCAGKLGVFEGYKELLLEEILADKTIEAVIVETDEIHLNKYAIMALRAGKHVHMEKPGSQSLSSFNELISEAKSSDKVFHIGYMYRYNPIVLELENRIKSGEFGKIHAIEAQMNCNQTTEARQWLSTFKGGMMFYLGCHLVDLILRILGEPERIISMNKSTGAAGISSEDFGMALLEYEDGVSFVKCDGCEVGGYMRRQLVVVGSEGTVEIKPFEIMDDPKKLTVLTKGVVYKDKSWFDEGASISTEAFNRYGDMMLAFAAMVRGERENPNTPDYEAMLFKTVMKCCGVEN